MGVFKWLRRERVTVTTHTPTGSNTPENQYSQSASQIGTIRTEEYKRDLAEFQARRSLGVKESQETPIKKRCGRHSLPVSCTDCTADHDNTFNYDMKSAIKYKKKIQKRAKSTTPDRTVYDHTGVPNIQFLFQNQVFMPGNMFPTSYSEPHRVRRQSRQRSEISPDMDFLVQKHIDFKENDQPKSPKFNKHNSLPFDVKDFLESSSNDDEIDGIKVTCDVKSSQNSSNSVNKDDTDEKLWEVMSELQSFDQWADEQLQDRYPGTIKSEDNKSDSSVYGLPIASVSNLDVTADKEKTWNHGKWGVVPVQIKKLNGITLQHVRKKQNIEINILRNCRHPNIILLMGLYPDIHGNVHIICERCVDSIFDILHVQGRILSAQTSVQYALDVANSLVFLRMQGYVHTELTSSHIMITSNDTAKLADVGSCVKLDKLNRTHPKDYNVYSPEPYYINLQDTRESKVADCEPLISAHPSETYISCNAVSKSYKSYEMSELYRWQAPEMFEPDGDGLVHPCSKSDVYSLCLILWECCNAAMPWKNLTYDKLKEQYTLWRTGVPLHKDGTYPGCLLSLLQSGLALQRYERIDIETLQNTLQNAKRNLDKLGYIIIPARLPSKPTFSNTAWDTTSPTDSECCSPQNIQHKAVIHNVQNSSTESEKDYTKSESSPKYETLRKYNRSTTDSEPAKCIMSDEDCEKKPLNYEHILDKDNSSACSTPIAKIRARIKDMETPGSLHRTDSTEYCSFLSPNRTVNFGAEDKGNTERPLSKLSRSFTPKSYKPLHIKVPEYNFDSIKPLLKDNSDSERSSYNFDIKNYSLPTTPIARSNKLRKNAWLSGDMDQTLAEIRKRKDRSLTPEKDSRPHIETCIEMHVTPVNTSPEVANVEDNSPFPGTSPEIATNNESPKSIDDNRDHITGLRRTSLPHDFLSMENEVNKDSMNLWSMKSNSDRNIGKSKVEEDDVLLKVNVKPLVAIHERWIYEANRKSERSMSFPDDNRSQIPAVKPASHCVDTLQKSLPQLNSKKPTNKFRVHPTSPNSGKHDSQWERFCQTRDRIAKNMNFTREPERIMRNNDSHKGTASEKPKEQLKVDQSTDTRSIEEFIRDLIRKEFQHLINEMSDDTSVPSMATKNEEILNKGVANIMESLNEEKSKKDVKSFSRVKINGNNKPLLQITFSRSGENSLQVLDNCVNVTICDNGKDKLNQSMEDGLTDEIHINALKRCQAFNALQEAKSTEDLYIDDDLSTMQENFGGKVKLIPLHGSLHEILCEKEDDCCLIKVKQENGCDTIYFRCDNSDTDSRDAIDGTTHERSKDTVVFKRSISLVEERIQRIFPKDKRVNTNLTRRAKPPEKMRPKSEIFVPTLNLDSRARSNSTPSLPTNDKADEIEVNIENVFSYQDSSSDECLKCQVENDDFELLERKIEEDLANSNKSSMTCGCLAKISEENLSLLNEDVEKD